MELGWCKRPLRNNTSTWPTAWKNGEHNKPGKRGILPPSWSFRRMTTFPARRINLFLCRIMRSALLRAFAPFRPAHNAVLHSPSVLLTYLQARTRSDSAVTAARGRSKHVFPRRVVFRSVTRRTTKTFARMNDDSYEKSRHFKHALQSSWNARRIKTCIKWTLLKLWEKWKRFKWDSANRKCWAWLKIYSTKSHSRN